MSRGGSPSSTNPNHVSTLFTELMTTPLSVVDQR